MEHGAAVSHGPVRTSRSLLTNEPVLHSQDVVGEFLAIKDVAELCAELVVLVVRDLQESAFDPERVTEVVIEIVPGDLDRPACEIFSVEELDPFLLIRLALSEGAADSGYSRGHRIGDEHHARNCLHFFFVFVVLWLALRNSISSDHFPDHAAADVSELLEAPGVEKCQTVLIEAKEVEQGGVDVAHWNLFPHSAHAEIVGLAESRARLRIPAGHPYHQAVLLVITTWFGRGEIVVERRSAHLRSPNDERLIEQSARLQILQKPGDRFVDLLAVHGESLMHGAMHVLTVVT